MSICDAPNYTSIVVKKSGKVDLKSVLLLLMENGVPPIFARAIILNLDKNNDGLISEEELRDSPLCREKYDQGTADERLKSIFDSIDVDGNGFIEMDELRTLSEKLDPNLRESLCKCLCGQLEKMDTDADGKVSFEEFLAAAKRFD